jgi:hypothetical protein
LKQWAETNNTRNNMNKNTKVKAKASRQHHLNGTDSHESNPVKHGPLAFQHPHKAINRRAKDHPNSWRVKASKAVTASA